MLSIFEAIARFRSLIENSNLDKAGKAAEKLRKSLGTPVWLAGVGIYYDTGRSRAVIQVSIKPGYHPSALPTHVDGIPVISTKTNLTGNLPF